MAVTEREIETVLAARYGETVVKRVLALLAGRGLWGATGQAHTLSAARDQLSLLVRHSRSGKAQLIQQGHNDPVVMLSIDDLLTMLCQMASSTTFGDLLRQLGDGPVLAGPVRPLHRGGALQLPVVEAGASPAQD